MVEIAWSSLLAKYIDFYALLLLVAGINIYLAGKYLFFEVMWLVRAVFLLLLLSSFTYWIYHSFYSNSPTTFDNNLITIFGFVILSYYLLVSVNSISRSLLEQ